MAAQIVRWRQIARIRDLCTVLRISLIEHAKIAQARTSAFQWLIAIVSMNAQRASLFGIEHKLIRLSLFNSFN
jgi:hypothetical protein